MLSDIIHLISSSGKRQYDAESIKDASTLPVGSVIISSGTKDVYIRLVTGHDGDYVDGICLAEFHKGCGEVHIAKLDNFGKRTSCHRNVVEENYQLLRPKQ